VTTPPASTPDLPLEGAADPELAPRASDDAHGSQPLADGGPIEPESAAEAPVASDDAEPEFAGEAPVASDDAEPESAAEAPVASDDAEPEFAAEAPVALDDAEPDAELEAEAVRALTDDVAENAGPDAMEAGTPLDPAESADADADAGSATEPVAAASDPVPSVDDPAVLKEPRRSGKKSAAKSEISESHLKGLVEALVFASDKPLKANEIARLASAGTRQITKVLDELRGEYTHRGIQLDEVAGGWTFRTSAVFAPFVRDLTGHKPVRLSRAQVETLAIVAYRQPITRPEVDDIRGVDCGAVLKMLLERDLVRILGKKDEPGRPILYGTSGGFLELFGLKSLKDLPTLREFTELNEDSRRVVEKELGDVVDGAGGVDALVDALRGPTDVEAVSDPEEIPAPPVSNPLLNLEIIADDEGELEGARAMFLGDSEPGDDMLEPSTDDEASEQGAPAEASAVAQDAAVTALADGDDQSPLPVAQSYDPADELEFPDDEDEDDEDEDEDDDDDDEDDEDDDDDDDEDDDNDDA